MRILVISDLHMDHRPAWKMPRLDELPDFDVAVFAGDINGSPSEGMRWIRQQEGFEYAEIIFVAGNHEYYGHNIQEEETAAVEVAAATRIHFLNASAVPIIDGVRFLGCTLWTDYSIMGNQERAMQAAEFMMNDHRLIKKKWDGQTTKFLPRDALLRHECERAWLEAKLREPHEGPTVVVTHHCIGWGSVPPRFLRDQVTPAFASDLTPAILKLQPELWIHGHTHSGFDYEIGATRVICNPKGYGPQPMPKDQAHLPIGPAENPLFDPLMVVEIPSPKLVP
ncbi:putative phosphodiesterase [Bradyrhizobium sp. USDA 4341]